MPDIITKEEARKLAMCYGAWTCARGEKMMQECSNALVLKQKAYDIELVDCDILNTIIKEGIN